MKYEKQIWVKNEVIFLGSVPLFLYFHDVIHIDKSEMAGHWVDIEMQSRLAGDYLHQI